VLTTGAARCAAHVVEGRPAMAKKKKDKKKRGKKKK
jgi:hypothetical protein